MCFIERQNNSGDGTDECAEHLRGGRRAGGAAGADAGGHPRRPPAGAPHVRRRRAAHGLREHRHHRLHSARVRLRRTQRRNRYCQVCHGLSYILSARSSLKLSYSAPLHYIASSHVLYRRSRSVLCRCANRVNLLNSCVRSGVLVVM